MSLIGIFGLLRCYRCDRTDPIFEPPALGQPVLCKICKDLLEEEREVTAVRRSPGL